MGVCKGPYSPSLVKAWHAWEAQHGSENEPVDQQQPGQLYLVIAMQHCGLDLEKCELRSFEQARSLLAQVGYAVGGTEARKHGSQALHTRARAAGANVH